MSVTSCWFRVRHGHDHAADPEFGGCPSQGWTNMIILPLPRVRDIRIAVLLMPMITNTHIEIEMYERERKTKRRSRGGVLGGGGVYPTLQTRKSVAFRWGMEQIERSLLSPRIIKFSTFERFNTSSTLTFTKTKLYRNNLVPVSTFAPLPSNNNHEAKTWA